MFQCCRHTPAPALISPPKNMNYRLAKGAPPNSIGFASPSGWINEDLFSGWLQHLTKFAKPIMSDKHVVILDGHSSHKSLKAVNLVRDNGLILISPHTFEITRLQKCFVVYIIALLMLTREAVISNILEFFDTTQRGSLTMTFKHCLLSDRRN